MRELAESAQLRWITVYYHLRCWVADGSFHRLWIGLLRRFKHCLDLSSIQLVGSQPLIKRGSQAVSYHHRNSDNTTNILLLSDISGIPVSVCQPIEGNHHDVYKIAEFMNQNFKLLREEDIEMTVYFSMQTQALIPQKSGKYVKKTVSLLILFSIHVMALSMTAKSSSIKSSIIDELLMKN